MIRNPFIIAGKIPPEYFCDRNSEKSKIISLIENNNNIVLISPRRMGKTGLIHFCLDMKEIKDNFNTVFIDILQTTSLQEFTFLLGKEIFESILPKNKKIASKFLQTLKSLSGKFTFDPISNAPSFSIQLGDIVQPVYTLKEIFSFLNASSSPTLIAIDEFQQIANYPEKNVEALLRSHIQNSLNCNFIFAGSQRHVMQQMFAYPSNPFYNSSTIMHLDAIPLAEYCDFAIEMFDKYNKKIEKKSIEYVYGLFDGYTFYMQKVFNDSFAKISENENCTLNIIQKSINEIIESSSSIFRELLSSIPLRQKELLISIAQSGNAENITSIDFINKFGLTSASSVQAAAKKLIERNIITRTDNKYSLTDKFMAMWLRAVY